ncbi:MerR family transcriptional regulator [Streptomyces sp. NPDC059740]|uniref:MerR family transcriptional regulator n=1 Tax=Streptomyces sp. NPDC059740 TaxID=3346926 RepID=UPI00364FE206
MTELAERAGVSVRTIRFYRERRLLPPPRREGRIAWYDEHHLARLRIISGLLERGHALSGIAELLSAFDQGHDVGELLGVREPLVAPWSQETPVRLTAEELADHFKDDVTAENLADSLDIGYLAVDGDDFVHVSRRLLDASTTLVDKGVPLAAVLAAGRRVREHADALARLFTDVLHHHVVTPLLTHGPSDVPETERVAELTALLEQLRPVTQAILDAEMSMAMDRRIRSEVEGWLRTGRRPDAPHENPPPAHGDAAEGGDG